MLVELIFRLFSFFYSFSFKIIYSQQKASAARAASDVVPLRHPVGEVVAPHYRQLRSVERDDVFRTVGWSNDLRGNENHVNQLSEEHEAKREQLHCSDAVIA